MATVLRLLLMVAHLLAVVLSDDVAHRSRDPTTRSSATEGALSHRIHLKHNRTNANGPPPNAFVHLFESRECRLFHLHSSSPEGRGRRVGFVLNTLSEEGDGTAARLITREDVVNCPNVDTLGWQDVATKNVPWSVPMSLTGWDYYKNIPTPSWCGANSSLSSATLLAKHHHHRRVTAPSREGRSGMSSSPPSEQQVVSPSPTKILANTKRYILALPVSTRWLCTVSRILLNQVRFPCRLGVPSSARPPQLSSKKLAHSSKRRRERQQQKRQSPRDRYQWADGKLRRCIDVVVSFRYRFIYVDNVKTGQ